MGRSYSYVQTLALQSKEFENPTKLIPGFIDDLATVYPDFKKIEKEHIVLTYKFIMAIRDDLRNKIVTVKREIAEGIIVVPTPPESDNGSEDHHELDDEANAADESQAEE